MRKRKIGLWLGIIGGLLAFSALSAPPVEANAGESIQSYQTNITVRSDGSALIEETLNYDFGSEDRHGIIRAIPLSAKLPNGKYFNYEFKTESVQRDGMTEPFTEKKQGTYNEIKIGSANKTIAGAHRYVIIYTASRVMQKDEAGDYFNWDVIGTSWPVPIRSSRAIITFPDEAPVLDSMRCYAGAQGSTDMGGCELTKSGQTITASIGALSANEGATVNILTEANSFQQYLEESDAPKGESLTDAGLPGILAIFIFTILPFLAVPLIFVVIAVVYLRNRVQTKQRQKQQTVIAQYEAPDNLTPAQLGLLQDSVAGMTEITATLIDLAVRGFIKITNVTKGSFIKTIDYQFDLLKSTSDKELQGYEQQLLLAMFGGHKQINLRKIDRMSMSTAVAAIAKQLKQELQQRGYFAQKLKWLNDPDNVTPDGYKAWARVEGFKLFLSVTERDRLKFTDAPAKNPEQFSRLLPYAIALGVEKEWAAQFAGMDVAQNLSWYSDPSSTRFNSVLLVNNLSGSFSTAVSSGFSSPSSSGGSSGGGFSGGGGGGGGGGSW
ncbi:DUF2207 domain-containing protein [bacterium]|nr:DUF2207 domain-containing protein [bacterium]